MIYLGENINDEFGFFQPQTKRNNRHKVEYPCNECDYVATQTGHLKTHIEIKHKGIRYPCSKCDYAAKTAINLNRHVKNIHKRVRYYPCSKCVYIATTANALNKHVENKHEGLRYPCSQCDYIATLASALKVHVESKHEGVRIPCSQCEYSATDTSTLKRHVEMAALIKGELDVEEFEIKEKIVSIKEDILPFSTVEDTCTINLLKDDFKMEYTGIQSKLEKFSYIKYRI